MFDFIRKGRRDSNIRKALGEVGPMDIDGGQIARLGARSTRNIAYGQNTTFSPKLTISSQGGDILNPKLRGGLAPASPPPPSPARGFHTPPIEGPRPNFKVPRQQVDPRRAIVPYTGWERGGVASGQEIVPYVAPKSAPNRGGLGLGGFKNISGLRMMRYAGAGALGLAAVNRMGRSYESLQNGRVGSSMANAAFGAGLAYAAYDLGIARGALSQHLGKMASGHASKLARNANPILSKIGNFAAKGMRAL